MKTSAWASVSLYLILLSTSTVFALNQESDSGVRSFSENIYNRDLSTVVLTQNYEKIYAATVTESSLAGVFGNLTRLIVNFANSNHKSFLDRDLEKMEKALQYMALSNLEYLLSPPQDILIQNLELPEPVKAVRQDVIREVKKLNAKVLRCAFDYRTGEITFGTSEEIKPLDNESSFCVMYNSNAMNLLETVVLVDLLSKREHFPTCNKKSIQSICVESSAENLSQYRLHDTRDSITAFQALRSYRQYAVSIFKPVGAILESGKKQIPIYCIRTNTHFFKASHRQDCDGNAITTTER